MRVWLINNTRFGHRNGSREWVDIMFGYFENHYLPMLEKQHKAGDIVVHTGGLFAGSDNINVRVLNRVCGIFERITRSCDLYLMVGKDDIVGNGGTTLDIFRGKPRVTVVSNVCYPSGNVNLISYKEFDPMDFSARVNIFSGTVPDGNVLSNKVYSCDGGDDDRLVVGNVTVVGSMYQFDGTNEDKGAYVIDDASGRDIFVPNRYSPVRRLITINHIGDLDGVDRDFVDKNHVSVRINNEIRRESELKLDILLSKYRFRKIDYFSVKEDDTEPVYSVDDVDGGSRLPSLIDIMRNKVVSECSPEALVEFDKIVKIYESRV